MSASVLQKSEALETVSACLAQNLLGRPHSLAQLDRIAEIGEGSFQCCQTDNDIGFVGVSQVGQAEDLPLELRLSARNGDAVGRSKGLYDGAGLDTQRGSNGGQGCGGPLGEQFEPERPDGGVGRPRKPVM